MRRQFRTSRLLPFQQLHQQQSQMDGVSAAASIFAVLQLTVEVVGYLKDVKNAPKECQHCQAEASSVRDLLNDLLFHLNQGIASEAWYTNVRALTIENGPLAQYKQALEQLLSKVEIQDHLREMKKRFIWKFTKKEVSSILLRMERLKSLINIALGMDHFKLSQAIKTDTTSIPLLQANTNAIKETQSVQQNQTLLQWLSPSDFPTMQQDMISRRQDGTAQWFLNSGEFEMWTDGIEKTLFCPGIPGAGKTMMAAVGIDHLKQITNANDTGLAYLFCSYKAQFEQIAQNLLAALLKQLIQSRPDLVSLLGNLHEKHHGGKASCDEIYEALETVCLAHNMVYLVVDALDEYDDKDGTRSEWIDKILHLQASTDVRILFTSRAIPTITEKFQTTLTLEVRASEGDVRRFVEGRLPRLPRCIQHDRGLQNMIVNTIAEATDGMFLLAQLHVESFYDKRNRSRVKSTLYKISRESGTLDEAYSKRYDEAIERIDNQSLDDRFLARRALCWISYVQRLLTTDELSCALAIEPGDQSLEHDNVYDIEEVISVCAGLVTIDVESRVIRLVHYTTQEYFERVRRTWYPEAQADIATTCLTYLSFDTFQTGSCANIWDMRHRLAENKFFAYSAQFWGEHIGQVQTSGLSELALTFLRNDALVESAFEVEILRKYSYNDNECENLVRNLRHQISGLHLTAAKGLQTLTTLILEDEKLRSMANTRDLFGETPLSRAVAQEDEAIVQLLLETGKVDVNLEDSIFGQTPLSRAAAHGHEAIVRLLLGTGKADVDSRNYSGDTPLLRAVTFGHEAVVRLLLETDKVDVNSTDSILGLTPLSIAAQFGYEAIVRLLLETGKVDVNSRDNKGNTPLSIAALFGYEAMVRLLLKTGKVDVNSRDNEGNTALSLATNGEHEAVVRLLERSISITGHNAPVKVN